MHQNPNLATWHCAFRIGQFFFHHIPVLIVHVLSDQCVWLDCAIGIHFRHVHVVNEVDEFLGPRWAIIPT